MLERYDVDLRARLALQLDGSPIESAETTRLVYRALLSTLEPRFERTLDTLRRLDVALFSSPVDDVASLFHLMKIETSALELSDAQLAVIGCAGRMPAISGAELVEFFERGGVLVTSDRTIAALPMEIKSLVIDQPAPPRRGRVVVSERSTQGWPLIAGAGAEFAAAVTLDAGHIPVDCVRDTSDPAAVLAYDVLDARPLVVVVPVGNGWIIHSVAHWYQHAPDRPTAVERRLIDPLQSPGADLEVPQGTTLGLFLCARVMLYCLLSGLEIAFNTASSDVASEAL